MPNYVGCLLEHNMNFEAQIVRQFGICLTQ